MTGFHLREVSGVQQQQGNSNAESFARTSIVASFAPVVKSLSRGVDSGRRRMPADAPYEGVHTRGSVTTGLTAALSPGALRSRDSTRLAL